MKAINAIRMGGVDVLPLVEGGKGIAVSNGISSGHWALGRRRRHVQRRQRRQLRRRRPAASRRSITAAPGASGTRSWSTIGIQGGIAQARQAHELSGGKGRIHANILWEMGGAERVITGVLEGAKGLIHGLTCGAGMPYRLSDIAARFGVHYYPIVSSARAFNALWKRAYTKAAALLGGVVYEDPWLAGGHNGLSNSEDPTKPEDPFPRVLALRKLMREFGLDETPIIMAGGVWWLEEWEDWIDNPELGPDRVPVRHPPAADPGKPDQRRLEAAAADAEGRRRLPQPVQPDRLLLRRRQQRLHRRSCAQRSEHQVAYTTEPVGEHVAAVRRRPAQAHRLSDAGRPGPRPSAGRREGFTEALRTPDSTLVFVTPEQGARDPRRPGRLHGLPQPVPLLQLEPARAGLHHRQEGRPAQLLHPEDAAERSRMQATDAGGARATT